MEIILDLWERLPSTAGHVVGGSSTAGGSGQAHQEVGRGQGMLGKEVGIEPDQGRVLSRRET